MIGTVKSIMWEKLAILWRILILSSWKKILIIGVHRNSMYA